MKKLVLRVLVGACVASGVLIADADAWRNGFITAYKAMKADSNIQGLLEQEISTKRWIVYYDATSDELAEWDKLMVQMLGYTTSIYNPVRTTESWIIFASFDSYGTAKQEADMMNQKIFKGQPKGLEIFDNHSNKRVFKAAKTLLAEDISHLKEILQKEAEIELAKAVEAKKLELEKNQKVAVVYVDPSNMKQIDPTRKVAIPVPTVEEVAVDTMKNSAKSNKSEAVATNSKKTTTKEKEHEKFAPNALKKPIGSLVLTNSTAIAYRLKTDKKVLEQTTLSIRDIEVAGVVDNNGEKHPVGAIVRDSDGLEYYKIYGKNLFVGASMAHFTKE